MDINGKIIVNGAFWVSLTSILGVPLTLYLNWILGLYDTTGKVLGQYAILIIFINTITTFVLFGGSSVLTNFLPKIDNEYDKGRFLSTYGLITLVTFTVFSIVLLSFPNISQALFGEEISNNDLYYFIFTGPFICISQVLIFALQGTMQFKRASILSQLRVIIFSLVVTGIYLAHNQILKEEGVLIFCILIIIISIVSSLFSLKKIKIRFGLFWTKQITNFSSYSYLNTINTYIFSNVDKIIILNYIGLEEVGIFYVLTQFAMLIKFVAIRIGQVLLSSFSQLVHNKEFEKVKNIYKSTTRIMIFISTLIAITLLIFSLFFVNIFGTLYTGYIPFLIILIVGVNFANIGSINSMYILAFEKNRAFFLNSLLLVSLQILITLIFIDDFGILAVIAGRISGEFLGQIGLFRIMYKIANILPSKEYILSQVVVVISAAVTYGYYIKTLNLLSFSIILFVLVLVYLRFSEIKLSQLKNIINRK